MRQSSAKTMANGHGKPKDLSNLRVLPIALRGKKSPAKADKYRVSPGLVALMIYGCYWNDDKHTALGFAVSKDGLNWSKHPDNPVFRPEPRHDWESNFTTSQTLLRLPDGSFRIWYAGRRQPPWSNLYFAIGTAHWSGPGK